MNKQTDEYHPATVTAAQILEWAREDISNAGLKFVDSWMEMYERLLQRMDAEKEWKELDEFYTSLFK